MEGAFDYEAHRCAMYCHVPSARGAVTFRTGIKGHQFSYSSEPGRGLCCCTLLQLLVVCTRCQRSGLGALAAPALHSSGAQEILHSEGAYTLGPGFQSEFCSGFRCSDMFRSSAGA